MASIDNQFIDGLLLISSFLFYSTEGGTRQRRKESQKSALGGTSHGNGHSKAGKYLSLFSAKNSFSFLYCRQALKFLDCTGRILHAQWHKNLDKVLKQVSIALRATYHLYGECTSIPASFS